MVELWRNFCVIYCIISRTDTLGEGNPASAKERTGATFQTPSAKLYVSVVTLSINDNSKFLENKKQGFKRIIS